MPKRQFKKVFVFLDTEKHASLFDILTTTDAFPDATILKFENVTAQDAEKIVYDAIFPRGLEGAKNTKIFINGSDLERTNEILNAARKSMVPPFEFSVIIDPRGAYTTASAAVAKTLKASFDHGIGKPGDQRVTILAGTGPVGKTAAKLYASEKARVTVTSRTMEKALSAAAKINTELKTEAVIGLQTQTLEQTEEAIADADIILAAGAAGTHLLSLETLKKRKKKRVILADVNAIPPLGIAGLDSSSDGNEISPNVIGFGALAIGEFKNKIEVALIKKAVEAPRGIFDYEASYEIAKKSVLKEKVTKTAKPESPKSWLP